MTLSPARARVFGRRRERCPRLGAVDTPRDVALPYLTSAFGVFLLLRTFGAEPQSLEDAARVKSCGALEVLWRVNAPAAYPDSPKTGEAVRSGRNARNERPLSPTSRGGIDSPAMTQTGGECT